METPPPPYEIDPNPSNVGICSIQFSESDKVRLNGTPFPDVIIPLREAIESSWPKGIQDERYFHGSHQFKLFGRPWIGTGQESIDSRRLLTALLICMAEQGWDLLACCDPTKKSNDKDVMFFENATPDPEIQVFSISFNRTDRIRLIGTPESWLVGKFKEIVSTGWTAGIQHFQDYHGSIEAKLVGNPWFTSDGKESIAAKFFLCHVIVGFRRMGYKLYASVDISGRIGSGGGGGGSYASDLDVWVFRKITKVWH